MRLAGRRGTLLAALLLAGSTYLATVANAALPDAAAASTPEPASVNTTVFVPAVGYLRSSTFGVSLDLAELELGIGYGYQHGRFGVDVTGGFVWLPAGRTEAGRRMYGVLTEPLVLTFHQDWLRFGAGTSVGSLAAQRATNGEDQRDLSAALWGAVGVEPLGPSGRPLFVEARLGVLGWGSAAPMISLAVGMRACWFACR